MTPDRSKFYSWLCRNPWRMSIAIAVIPSIVFFVFSLIGWEKITTGYVAANTLQSLGLGLLAFFHTKQEIRLATKRGKRKNTTPGQYDLLN